MSSVKSIGRGKDSQNGTQKLFDYKGEPPTHTNHVFYHNIYFVCHELLQIHKLGN